LLAILLASCGSDTPTVPSGPAAITVTPTALSLQQHGTGQLTAQVVDAQGTPLSGQSLAFTSEDPTLALVTPTGAVTSVGPAGNTIITVESGSLRTWVSASIAQSPATLRTDGPIVVLAGASRQLTTSVLDAVGSPIPDAQVTYSSTAPELSVTPSGLVTALGPPGTFAVTTELGSLRKTLQVIVPTHPTAPAWRRSRSACSVGGWRSPRRARST